MSRLLRWHPQGLDELIREHVCPALFAKVRHFVDEGDLGREKGVGCYLISSAERRPVKRIGVSLMNSGRYRSRITRRARSSSKTVAPSRRSSHGHEYSRRLHE